MRRAAKSRLALLFAAALGLAATHFGCVVPRPSAVPDAFIDSLAQDLAGSVRTLNREVSLFHYTAREHLAGTDRSIDPFDSRRVGFIHYLTQWFWSDDPNCDLVQDCIMGKGMYAAIDPAASRGYGGDDWAMLRIALQPGTRILNSESAVFSSRDSEILRGWGCDQKGETDSPLALVGLFAAPQDPFCHAILKRLMRTLRIDGVTYDWTSATQANLCVGQLRTIAFVLIDDAHVAWEHTEAFTSQVPSPDPAAADRTEIQRVYAAATAGQALWASLAVPSYRAADSSWARQNVFSCGDHSEDAP